MFTVLLALSLVACGGESSAAQFENRTLDFKSIHDVELGLIFSLGDNKDDVVYVLGRPVSTDVDGDESEYIFHNGLTFLFIEDRAVWIQGENQLDTGRFEILAYRIGMTRSQVSRYFEVNETLSGLSMLDAYERAYDVSGNSVDKSDAVIFGDVHFRTLLDNVTVSVSVSYADW